MARGTCAILQCIVLLLLLNIWGIFDENLEVAASRWCWGSQKHAGSPWFFRLQAVPSISTLRFTQPLPLLSFLRRGSEHLMMYRARCMATSDIRRNGIRESHSEGLIIDPKSTLLCKPFECQWNSGQTNHYESPMPVRWCSGDLTATKFFKRTEVAAEAYLKLYCSVKFWSRLGCINC